MQVKLKLDALAGRATNKPAIINRSNSLERSLNEEEKSIVYYKGLLYSAKVIDKSKAFEGGKKKYLVHYLGWKKQWDEWVGAERIFESTDVVLHIQKKLFEFFKNIKREKNKVEIKQNVYNAKDKIASSDMGTEVLTTKNIEPESHVIRCLCKFL